MGFIKKLFVVAFVLIFLLTSGCSPERASAPAEFILVGHVVALSGEHGKWGESEKNALEMEAERINQAGGVLGKKIRIITYDTRADASETMNVTKRLIYQDKVVAIIGPGQSAAGIVMNAVAEPSKVPFIATAATNPKVTVDEKTNRVRPYAFRTCFVDSFQGTVAARFVFEGLKAKTAAVLSNAGSEYSLTLGSFFVAEFIRLGGKITANETFRSQDMELRPVFEKIKQGLPEVLFIPTLPKEAAFIAKQARDLAITAKFIGGDGWESPDLITLGGAAVEGSFLVSQASMEDPDIQPFIRRYREKYGKNPVLPNPINAIDGLLAVVHSIEMAGSADSVKIAAQLGQIRQLAVLSGKLSIDPLTHNPINKPAIIQEIRNGKFSYRVKMLEK